MKLATLSIEEQRKMNVGDVCVFERGRTDQQSRNAFTNAFRLKQGIVIETMILVDPVSGRSRKILIIERVS